MTPRRDDEVVDIEDGEDEEVFGGKALTPRVTQGDGLPQLEGLTEDKTNLAPTTWMPYVFLFSFFFFFLLWNFILIQEQAVCLVLVHMTLLSFYLKHSSVSLLIYLCECFHHYLRFLCKRIFLISHYHLLGILKIFCIMPLSALSAFRPYSHSRTVGPGTRRCPRWLVGRTSKKKNFELGTRQYPRRSVHPIGRA